MLEEPEQHSPIVGVIMGSTSDWSAMEHCVATLQRLEIPCEKKVISAHRIPDFFWEYVKSAANRGLECLIAGAGGAAHLPGMAAALTELPVLGVPMQSQSLNGLDSLLSIVQMPAGVPTATFSIGKAGAVNAALFAAAILGLKYPHIQEHLKAYRKEQSEKVLNAKLPE